MRQALHTVGVIMFGGAILFVIGTAGSSDIHAISFEQTIMQCVIGLLVGGIGFGIIKRTEEM